MLSRALQRAHPLSFKPLLVQHHDDDASWDLILSSLFKTFRLV
jgi:hypothetical protein